MADIQTLSLQRPCRHASAGFEKDSLLPPPARRRLLLARFDAFLQGSSLLAICSKILEGGQKVTGTRCPIRSIALLARRDRGRPDGDAVTTIHGITIP